VLAPGALAALVCLSVASFLLSGCFNPSINTGGFKCSSIYKKECPDGFQCVNGSCWKGGIVIPIDGGGGTPDVKPDSSVDTPSDKGPVGTDAPVDKKPDAPCTIKPVMSCTPVAGKCDPQCQTGCDGCYQKCSVNTMGALTCNAPSNGGTGQEGDTCEQVLAGTEQQTDNCSPGLVCVDRACKFECAKLCRGNDDCPGSTCSRDYATGFKVCDVKAVDCNPVRQGLGPTRCPGAAQGCYLSATIPDRTVCDCPFAAVGEGKSCKFSRDCLPGLVCVDATGTVDLRCYIACSLVGATSGCPTNEPNCRPLPTMPASTKYGYCRP
jgi:hypothetical protein